VYFKKYFYILTFLFTAEVSDSFDEDDEDGDSYSASPVNWSCPEKVSLKLHRQTQLNIERGEFLRRNQLYTESRFEHYSFILGLLCGRLKNVNLAIKPMTETRED